jgi:hypothetical protein
MIQQIVFLIFMRQYLPGLRSQYQYPSNDSCVYQLFIDDVELGIALVTQTAVHWLAWTSGYQTHKLMVEYADPQSFDSMEQWAKMVYDSLSKNGPGEFKSAI